MRYIQQTVRSAWFLVLVSKPVSKYLFLQYLECKMLLITASDTPLSWWVMQDEQADLLVVLWMNSAKLASICTNSHSADCESPCIGNS